MKVNYLSESLFEKAQANFISKKYSRTLDLLQNALDNLEDHQSPLKGHLYLLMAKTYFAMVKFRDARKVSEQALEYLGVYNRLFEAAQVYELLGHIACQTSQYPEAIKFYHKALSTLPSNPKSHHEKQLQAQVHLSLGLIAQNLLDITNQQKHFSRCLFIAKRINSIELHAEALLGLGTYFFQKQRFDHGRKILLKAFKFFNNLGNTQGIALSLHTLGQIYSKAKEFYRAINALKLAYYLFEYTDDQIHQACTLTHLARLYLQIDPEKGRELCGQATDLLSTQISVHSKRQSEIILGRSYVVMGLYYKLICKPEMARYYFKESMEIFQNYQCEQEFIETLDFLNNTALIEPKRRTKKNNILAFKLGMPG